MQNPQAANYTLVNERASYIALLEKEQVVFDPNKFPRQTYQKLLKLKETEGDDLHDLCREDEEAAKMVFSNIFLFEKLTKDQVALLIFGFGKQVLESAFSIKDIITKENISRLIFHAEDHEDTADFILKYPEILSLLDGKDFVKIAIHPSIAQRILDSQELVQKLGQSQRDEIANLKRNNSIFNK